MRSFILIKVLGLLEWHPLSRSAKAIRFEDALIGMGLDPNPIKEDFAVKLAATLAVLVKKAIDEQRFKKQYEPLSEPYAKRKKQSGGKQGFWRNTEYLVNHIDAWKDSDGELNVGFRETQKHPSGSSLSMIATVLELGYPDKNIPARPIFTPIARAMGKDISIYFKKYLAQHHPHLSQYWD